jgi:hypothetical protein
VSTPRIGPVTIAKAAGLFAYTLAVVVAVRLSLTLTSHRTVRKALPAGLSRAAPEPMVWRAARAVTLASRIVPGASCLTQALALQLILGHRGYATEVRIGVKADGSAVAAHAWLLSDGKVAIGGSPQEIAGYVPITMLGSRQT